MGALYLASKLEECPLRIRDLINVYDLLLRRATHSLDKDSGKAFKYTPMSYFGSTFYDLKDALVVAEMQILKRLGFNVQVVLPYGTLINYMRVLGLISRKDACSRAWGYLNDAWGSQQLSSLTVVSSSPSLQTPVYALYQVPTIVSAVILLTVRHLNISIPSTPPNCWWELFDTSWEDLWSVCGYVMRLYRKRSIEDMNRIIGMINKREVRKWLEANTQNSVSSLSQIH